MATSLAQRCISAYDNEAEDEIRAALALMDHQTLMRAAWEGFAIDVMALMRERTKNEEQAARAAWRLANPEQAAAAQAAADEKAAAEARRAWRQQGHGTARKGRTKCQCDDCCEWRKFSAELREASDAKFSKALGEIMQDYKKSLRAEWTDELLASPFAVGDGRIVTWGSATVADHEARAEMLSKMAAGTLETAAMHARAIEHIRTAGVETLADVTAVPA